MAHLEPRNQHFHMFGTYSESSCSFLFDSLSFALDLLLISPSFPVHILGMSFSYPFHASSFPLHSLPFFFIPAHCLPIFFISFSFPFTGSAKTHHFEVFLKIR